MITKEHKQMLKQLLKGDYTADVIKCLNEKGIYTQEGKSFSKGMIRMVYNGYAEHLPIEEAIFQVYKDRRETEKAIFQQRESLLSE